MRTDDELELLGNLDLAAESIKDMGPIFAEGELDDDMKAEVIARLDKLRKNTNAVLRTLRNA